MFYLLISKVWIRELNNKYDLFKLFTYGSVGYIFLHYYLNMRSYDGILGIIKNFFYYLMILDFVLAYCSLYQPKVEHYENAINDPEKEAIIKKINEVNNEPKQSGSGVFITKKEVEQQSENKAKITLLPQKEGEISQSEELPVYKAE